MTYLGSIQTQNKEEWQPKYMLVRIMFRICIMLRIYNESDEITADDNLFNYKATKHHNKLLRNCY